jgi:hypothetical protein
MWAGNERGLVNLRETLATPFLPSPFRPRPVLCTGLIRSVTLWAPPEAAARVPTRHGLRFRGAQVLLRWLARCLRAVNYPLNTLHRRRRFHAASASGVAAAAVEGFRRGAELRSNRASVPPHPRSLSGEKGACVELARDKLHSAFRACRWMPKVRFAHVAGSMSLGTARGARLPRHTVWT